MPCKYSLAHTRINEPLILPCNHRMCNHCFARTSIGVEHHQQQQLQPRRLSQQPLSSSIGGEQQQQQHVNDVSVFCAGCKV